MPLDSYVYLEQIAQNPTHPQSTSTHINHTHTSIHLHSPLMHNTFYKHSNRKYSHFIYFKQ